MPQQSFIALLRSIKLLLVPSPSAVVAQAAPLTASISQLLPMVDGMSMEGRLAAIETEVRRMMIDKASNKSTMKATGK